MTSDLKDLPGVKRSEIQKCAMCNKGIMHDRSLTFYTVQIKYMVIDPGAIQRQHGLEMFMGGDHMAGIATVMGPDEDIAKELSSNSAWLCMECAMKHPLCAIQETFQEKEITDNCEHNWISAKNEIVENGSLCTLCGALKTEDTK